MMNKYTHHPSVAFVVCLEKFPIIGYKKTSPKFVFQTELGGGVFYRAYVCKQYVGFIYFLLEVKVVPGRQMLIQNPILLFLSALLETVVQTAYLVSWMSWLL